MIGIDITLSFKIVNIDNYMLIGLIKTCIDLMILCSFFPRYDYVLSREYNWNVKNKLSRGYEETYFFVFREGGMYYNELETR